MNPPRLLVCLVLAALAAPAAAWGGGATITSRDVPLHGERTLAASAPARFTLVGLHWQGRGSVQFRTRSLDGRWTPWQDAAPEAEDQPDRGSPERARAGRWRLGNPWWVGPSNAIRYRLRGEVRRLQAWFVWSPEVRVPLRTTAIAGAPPMITRAGWNADETIRRARPSYADVLRFAIVHHTAGRSAYGPAESAAIVRGIELYHVKGNGWNDIGYNFLVDRYGKVFEGRYGGVDRNVVGAHAEGFNTGSVGVAVIGDYDDTSTPKAAEDALAGLLAWRLDIAHVDPLGTLSAISGGNARYPGGLPVFLRAISGHRDTGFTECPGDRLYARLGAIATNAARIGLPKVYDPQATGSLGGLVRFRARLSSSLPWSVTVADAQGIEVARQDGFGLAIDWTWDSTGVPGGRYSWSIDTPGATPATGAVGQGAVALALTGVAADPETVSPNGDGQADLSTLTYTLTAAATVTVTALDPVGAEIATVLPPTRQGAGAHAVEFDAAALDDGTYQLRLSARAGSGPEVTAVVQVLVSRTLGTVAVAPALFSPNGDGRKDRLRVSFALASPAAVRVRVLRDGKYVTTLLNGSLPPGVQRLEWDGSKRIGRLLDGSYETVVEATDVVGTSTMSLPFGSDTHAPVVRILKGRPLRLWVSEPAILTLRVNGRSLRQDATAPGELRVAWRGPAGHVRAVAWDGAGNVSRPAVRP